MLRPGTEKMPGAVNIRFRDIDEIVYAKFKLFVGRTARCQFEMARAEAYALCVHLNSEAMG